MSLGVKEVRLGSSSRVDEEEGEGDLERARIVDAGPWATAVCGVVVLDRHDAAVRAADHDKVAQPEDER